MEASSSSPALLWEVKADLDKLQRKPLSSGSMSPAIGEGGSTSNRVSGSTLVCLALGVVSGVLDSMIGGGCQRYCLGMVELWDLWVERIWELRDVEEGSPI